MVEYNYIMLTAADGGALEMAKGKLEKAKIPYRLKVLPHSQTAGFGSIVSTRCEILVPEIYILKARSVIGEENAGKKSGSKAGRVLQTAVMLAVLALLIALGYRWLVTGGLF